MSKVKIVTFAPLQDADAIRQAMGAAGSGVQGEYSFCSFTVRGTGRYLPSENAHPHIGRAGIAQEIEEALIEVTCDRGIAKKVIDAIKIAHPYEEVAFDIYPLIEESDL